MVDLLSSMPYIKRVQINVQFTPYLLKETLNNVKLSYQIKQNT